MPSLKTNATELSVAFGILGILNPEILTDNIQIQFEGTLEFKTYQQYIREFERDATLYLQFLQIGTTLRNVMFQEVNRIHWIGPQQQASTVSGAKDLYIPVTNTPISVKNDSNIVANLSPQNLFINLPRGESVQSLSEDWFIQKDYLGLQDLYEYVRKFYNTNLPLDVRDFYRNTSRVGRKLLQNFLKNGSNGFDYEVFIRKYLTMCRNVSIASADEFNNNLARLESNRRVAVFENVIKQFLELIQLHMC